MIRLTTLVFVIAAFTLASCGGDDDAVGGGNESGTEVAKAGDLSGEVTISTARLHGPGQGEHGRRVRAGEGRKDQIHRGRERQRRVLRQAAAPAREGRFRRTEHVRGHRLDGQADVRPRLPAGDRPRRPADRVQEPPAEPREPRLRPRAQVLRAVADRNDRAHGQRRKGAGCKSGQRHLRPEVQGQDHRAHRVARHDPAAAQGRTGSIPRKPPPKNGLLQSRSCRTPSTPASCAASPATTTPRT